MKIRSTYFFSLLLLSGCGRLDQLVYEPGLTPEMWCANQPCMRIGSLILSQPSSSVIVLILALLSIGVAFYFLRSQGNQLSRKWWGIAMLLGGVGALLAGTSYQAFGYEIKCAGCEFCAWTSWWEIGYEILTVAGAGALLIAVAYSCFSIKWQKVCSIIAGVNTLVYSVVVITGAMLPDQFMVSFELMILFTAPIYFVILIINTVQYLRKRRTLLLRLIISWVLLFTTLVAYYWYFMAGITQELWAQGIWFSENDVLHIGMIGWVLYVYIVLGKSVCDT